MIDADKQLKQLEGDYETTFSTKEGERVLADLESAYYHRSSFTKDPYETAFNEGSRAVIVSTLHLIRSRNK